MRSEEGHQSTSGLSHDAGGLDAFKRRVWEAGRKWGRPDLPWRRTRDPYEVYVSEVMLQQTQVARVLKRWPRFVSRFPSLDALSAASSADVLQEWQGMGYNRRGLALKRTADLCVAEHGGCLPQTAEGLEALPGIGPTTAAGIMAFAHQVPGVYLETNVRAVFIHEFFPESLGGPGLSAAPAKVSDRQIRPLVARTCSQDDPRGWYYALMDWGAHLKATGANPTRAAKAYKRQSRFEGSKRQKRAFVLRDVLGAPGVTEAQAHADLDRFEVSAGRAPVGDAAFDAVVAGLAEDGFFRRVDGRLVP